MNTAQINRWYMRKETQSAAGSKRRSRRSVFSLEFLEQRQLLAGDLVAHWRAEDLVATTADGATLTSWEDNVGNLSAAAAGSPVLSHTAMGGRAGIQFSPDDGAAESFLVRSLDSPMSNATDFTVAVVFSTSETQLAGDTGIWSNDTALVDAYGFGFANDWGVTLNASAQVGAGLGQFGGAPTSLYSDQAGNNDGQTHIAVYRHEGNRITLQVDDNAPVVAENVSSAPRSSLNLRIGDRESDATAAFDGYVAEVRVYDGALDPNATQELVSDLSGTYNNQAPVAENDSYTLQEDALIFLVPQSQGVLSNDTDVEGDPITAVVVDEPLHGSLQLSADGALIYSPDSNFFGTDSFTYSAVDFRPSAPATVTLNVTPTYDAVSTSPDSFLIRPGETLTTDSANGVLSNDDNPDQVVLTALLEQTVNDGELTFNPDGSFTYDPQGFVGTTSFSYRVNDGTATTEPVSVTIDVNSRPSGALDIYTATEDTLLTVGVAHGLLSNDTDADNDALTITIESSPTNGELEANPDGSFTYLADADYHGSDAFSYRASDGVESSGPTIVSITIDPVNDPPAANADAYITLPNQILTVAAARGVLANDTDVEGEALLAQLVSQPANGIVELADDGSFSYVPNADFIGNDQFTYLADDRLDRSAATVVELKVINDPVVINEFMAVNVDTIETRTRDNAEARFRGDRLSPDWIELRNQVDIAIDVGNMSLTDDPEETTKWTFPAGTVIPANGFLVVFASGVDIRDVALDEQGFLHTNFRIGNGGEFLGLYSADGNAIHTLDARSVEQYADISYGRSNGDTRYFSAPTLGAENGEGVLGRVSEPTFSVPHGYFDETFALQMTADVPGGTLIYTTDGSEPTLANGTVVAALAPDANPVVDLNIDSTTTLRVRSVLDARLDSTIATQTYFFVDDLVTQSDLWSTVTDHPEWGPQLKDSLTSIPSISLVIDGRIPNASEIATSVEMIFPDGSESGFQIDAGIEYYGGHSLNSPKRNMRLSFKGIYGDPSLEYDLFGPGAANEFGQLLLRGGSHDNWFWVHPSGGRGNYVRNRWAFDRQLEMGHLAPQGRPVQVFINGEYWGINQLMERPNADFMASYLGGDAEDYDALNAGTAIDGDTDAWRQLATNDVMDDYEEVQKYLDVVNYADYMLLQFYSGNDWDWNHSQNWAGARRREDGAGYIFFAWDSDVILRTTARATVIDRGGPGDLWNRNGGMKQHEEFRMLMADRAHRYLFNGGMFTSERLRADVDALAEPLRLPLIAETARWGRFGHGGLRYTPDVWEGAIDWMKDTFAPIGEGGRTETLLSQLQRADLYPATDAPEYTVNGDRQHGGRVTDTDAVQIIASEGTIYYTLDGSDPRLPGGVLNASAVQYGGQALPLGVGRTVKARALNNGEWSALSEADFLLNTINADADNLRISEVHYHPADPTDAEIAAGFSDADEFEFIEFVNIGSETLDLENVQLVRVLNEDGEQGVDFSFANADIKQLRAGERVVVVENSDAFEARYGSDIPLAGQWAGGLSNRQEVITVNAGDTTLLQFSYSDAWHPATDGTGPSLEVAAANQNIDLWQQAAGWRASAAVGGSPGTATASPPIGDSNGDGVFDSSDLVTVFQAGEYEDEILGNSTFDEGDWDGDGDFTTTDLVFAFQSGTYVSGAGPKTIEPLIWLPRRGETQAAFVGLADTDQRADVEDDLKRTRLDARDAIFGRWV